NQLQQEDKLNQQTIIGLQEEFLEAQGNQNQELQDQITTLVGERDNIQQELNNRQTEIRRLNNALQTAQQEKEKQKNKRISELNSSLSFLRGLLADKNQEVNDLEQRLIATDTLITNTQNLLGIDDLNNLPVLPEGETLIKQERADDLQEKLNIEKEIVGKIKTRQIKKDKNGEDYLLLRLTDNKKDLKVGVSYNFTVHEVEMGHLILKDFYEI
ncbi:14852_t:CDS:2, partial [Cetraspora pellucida]